MGIRAKKNPAAVALGRAGGKKGGPARAAKLSPEQRSKIARIAVQTRWAKNKQDRGFEVTKAIPVNPENRGSRIRKATAPAASPREASKMELHLCLDRIKAAKSESEIRRLTEDLQRIVFHRQYENAKD
jgi:hypothetical protein